MTDDLILRLSENLKPVSRLTVLRRLALGVGLGAAVSAALTGAILGFRTDMIAAAGELMFWVKLAYTLGLAGVALWAVEQLARPTGRGARRALAIAAPVIAVAALALWQFTHTPQPLRPHLVMGDSAALCPWCILTASLPPLLGLVWALRGLAPTRLRLTGLMIGLAAGGAGAAAYALHCPEPTAPFLAIWYSLGIGLAGLLGAALGPRVLRW